MIDKNLKIAAIQLASGPNVTANLAETERLIAEATENGAGLVVLPENFAFMGSREQDLLSLREQDGDGPLQAFLAQTARRFGVWLVGGTLPLGSARENRVRSACLLIDDQGRRVARYDKMHLFDVQLLDGDERYAESSVIDAGDQVVVADSPFGRLGLAVCYDLRFPELFRSMLDQGVELIAMPAAFTAITGKAHWEVLTRARAIENLCYLVAAAQGGFHVNGRETHGHSLILDPWGTIMAQVPRGSGTISAVLDRDYQATLRRTFPTLSHRRIQCL